MTGISPRSLRSCAAVVCCGGSAPAAGLLGGVALAAVAQFTAVTVVGLGLVVLIARRLDRCAPSHPPQHRRSVDTGPDEATMTDTYDLIVIGAGMAGAATANKCASEGWRVAIVDELPYGGTCALRGCDPKKILRRGADLPHRVLFVGGGSSRSSSRTSLLVPAQAPSPSTVAFAHSRASTPTSSSCWSNEGPTSASTCAGKRRSRRSSQPDPPTASPSRPPAPAPSSRPISSSTAPGASRSSRDSVWTPPTWRTAREASPLLATCRAQPTQRSMQRATPPPPPECHLKLELTTRQLKSMTATYPSVGSDLGSTL